MELFSFDGANRLITIASGVTEFDIQETYSAWKRWMGSGDNSKWPIAFETVGGDPLTPGINAGAYYFLRNDDGWRIKPPEEDTTIYLAGNLAPKNSSYPILTGTTGDFSVLVVGLQPITQSVEDILTLQQETSYFGQVSVDTMGNGSNGLTYPIGTESEPVNNFAQAHIIADSLGLSTFIINGMVTLNSGLLINNNPYSLTTHHFKSKGAIAEIYVDNVDISACSFEGCKIQGNIIDSWEKVIIRESKVYNLCNFYGAIAESIMEGEICFQTGLIEIHHCGSSFGGSVFNLRGMPINLTIREWIGPLNIVSGTHPDTSIIIDTTSSTITFDSTTISGNYTIYGVGNVINNSTGNPTINTSLLKSEQITSIENKINNLTALSI